MNINSKFTLQRPPKPQSKTIKPVQNFSSVYQNHLNFQLDSNNIKLASRRPTSQENHRHGIKFIRKRAVDSDGNEPVNSTSVLISPKYSSADSGQVNNTVSLQPSAFKIRNISIQVKKSK
jgi:hypothetical protein